MMDPLPIKLWESKLVELRKVLIWTVYFAARKREAQVRLKKNFITIHTPIADVKVDMQVPYGIPGDPYMVWITIGIFNKVVPMLLLKLVQCIETRSCTADITELCDKATDAANDLQALRPGGARAIIRSACPCCKVAAVQLDRNILQELLQILQNPIWPRLALYDQPEVPESEDSLDDELPSKRPRTETL